MPRGREIPERQHRVSKKGFIWNGTKTSLNIMGSGSSLLGALALPEHRFDCQQISSLFVFQNIIKPCGQAVNFSDKQRFKLWTKTTKYQVCNLRKNAFNLLVIRSSYFLFDHDITGAHVHHQCMCSETAKNPLEEICARTFVRDLSKRRKAVLERFAVYQREICKESMVSSNFSYIFLKMLLNTFKKRHHTTRWWKHLICQRKSIQQNRQLDQKEAKPNDKLEDNNEDAKKALDRDDPPMVENVMEDLTGMLLIENYI